MNIKLRFGMGNVENIVAKGENAVYQHFLLFPQCFQKVFVLMVVKCRNRVVNGHGMVHSSSSVMQEISRGKLECLLSLLSWGFFSPFPTFTLS